MDRIDIYDLWLSFVTTVNTFQGGWYRPQSDFQQKVNDISMSLWVKWTNEAEKSQEARDNLIFLLKSKNLIAIPAKANYSTVTPPPDYGRFADMAIVTTGDKTYPDNDIDEGNCDGLSDKEKITENYYNNIKTATIELIDKMRWNSCLNHETKSPTLEYPKAVQIEETFRVSPRTVSVVQLSYYIKPDNAVFGYTLAPGNRQTGAGMQIIFDKSKSNNPPWPPSVKNEFIVRLGEAYGLFTREQFVSGFSTQQKRDA